MSVSPPQDLTVSNLEFPASGIAQILRSKHRLRILWDLQHGFETIWRNTKKAEFGGSGPEGSCT